MLRINRLDLWKIVTPMYFLQHKKIFAILTDKYDEFDVILEFKF